MHNNYMLAMILMVMFALSWGIPFFSQVSEMEYTEYDVESLVDDVGQLDIDSADPTNPGFLGTVKRLSSVIFFSFGTLPLIIDLILMIPRIIMWVIIYDKIRGMN